MRLLMLPTLVFAISSVSYANEFADNLPKKLDRAVETMFAPVGEVEMPRGTDANGDNLFERGTGFLISPCYIVTNHHVVYGNVLPPPAANYDATFYAGPSPDHAFLGDTLGKTVCSGKREYDGRADWTVMRLRECIGGAPWNFGWLEYKVAPSARLVGLKVGNAGYAGASARGQLTWSKGIVNGVNTNEVPELNILANGLLSFTNSQSKGQSGGPVFASVGNVLSVVGVNVRQRISMDEVNARKSAPGKDWLFPTYTENHANEFLNIGEVVNDSCVKPLLAADLAGKTNPHLMKSTLPAGY